MEKQEVDQILEVLKTMQEEIIARMDANHEKMMAFTVNMKYSQEEKMACHGRMEERLQGEPASVDMTPEVAHEQEVPLEDAIIMPVGELRKRRRDRRNLAAVRRQKKEERNLDASLFSTSVSISELLYPDVTIAEPVILHCIRIYVML
jgi:hypothetical protein